MSSLTTSSAIVLAVVVLGAGTGAVIDLITRRIPNLVSLVTAVVGVVLAATGVTDISVALSVLGFVAGMLIMLPGHAVGATGAGDVKLFAAVGAVIGVERMPAAFLFTALAGGVAAIAFAIGQGRLTMTLRRTLRLLRAPSDAKSEIASHRLRRTGFRTGRRLRPAARWRYSSGGDTCRNGARSVGRR